MPQYDLTGSRSVKNAKMTPLSSVMLENRGHTAFIDAEFSACRFRNDPFSNRFPDSNITNANKGA